jgi:GNAT superfamily N-acetyltransferase
MYGTATLGRYSERPRPRPFAQRSHQVQVVPAEPDDREAVVQLFGALHSYNAGLDPHFALADNWQAVLREEFERTWDDPQRLWMLVTSGTRPVGLLIAAVHCDSPLFRHRHWVEVQALYVADSHRRLGIGRRLLEHAYAWAEQLELPRIQLYVTASNVRARSVYEEEGFAVTQAIMRKGL